MKDFNSVSRPQKENDVNKDIFNHCINLIGVCESENGARKQHQQDACGFTLCRLLLFFFE